MQIIDTRLASRGEPSHARRAALIAHRIDRFTSKHQPAIRTLADAHSRLADLALSFPALLFALAVPAPKSRRSEALARVLGGAPLNVAAAAAGVPMWLRRLPPEAFEAPLEQLPDDGDFRFQMANYLPASPIRAAAWLRCVSIASSWGSPEFAIWTARQVLDRRNLKYEGNLRLLALWSFYSTVSRGPGWARPDRCWSASIGMSTAVAAAKAWEEKIRLHLYLGSEPLEDCWLEPGMVDDYAFEPITTAAGLCAAAHSMRNCLRRYGYRIAGRHARIWAVRKDGRTIAILELGVRYREPLIDIFQLRGPGNRAAEKDVWWAARRWLMLNALDQIEIKSLKNQDVTFRREAWQQLWRPYWLAKRRIPDCLPLAPSREAWDRLSEC